jgi:hypothetical protein
MAKPDKETLDRTPPPSEFISAIFNSKTPEGLTLTESEWDNEYQGTEEAFLKAGFIKPEWLPGYAGNPKRKVTVTIINGELGILPPRFANKVTNYQWDNGYICITKSSTGLTAAVNCLAEEFEKREAIGFLKRKAERIEEARAEIDASIRQLPTRPEQYLHRSLHSIRAFTNLVRRDLTDSFGHSGGFGFPPELIGEFDSFVARFNQLLDDTSITFDQEKRDGEISAIEKEKLARHRLTAEDLQS